VTVASNLAAVGAPNVEATAATILIVDDNATNVGLLEKILTRAGMSGVKSTTDPREAIDLYRRHSPDLVMLDLHMPQMDGLHLMDALAAMTADDDLVPIIVLTADGTSAARDRVLEAGASDFLTKPFDRTDVILRARNLLHTRALHTKLRQHNLALGAEIRRRDAELTRAQNAHDEKQRRIRDVITTGAFHMVLQPIVDLRTGDVVGQEALARFDAEPDRPPSDWFVEAATVGLGIELELVAVDLALEQLGSLPTGQFLTLNVSPETTLTTALADRLARHERGRLVIEITEHAIIDDYEPLLAALGALRRVGVRLAVDDAGAGFASLSHILKLCPDIIKLDITLTRDIHADPVKRALAASLVSFAREITSMIIAEGIETDEEHRSLATLGVPWGQGYHLGRPSRPAG
jgi:EAL domain-containing protein (putative c-di-GMP-specific phosphodiesterase class I)/AmiR/NasT family two-component response regulator